MLFVIPRFEDFYAGLGGELPLMTRVLVAVARWAQRNVAWGLAGLALAVGVCPPVAQEGRCGRGDRQPAASSAPCRRLFRSTPRASSADALDPPGGWPALINALAVAAASVGNRTMARAVEQATPLIREGKSLTVALETTGMLENLALEMIKVGEQTGALGEMLGSIAEFYDEELESRMTTLMALIEPLMIVGMASSWL